MSVKSDCSDAVSTDEKKSRPAISRLSAYADYAYSRQDLDALKFLAGKKIPNLEKKIAENIKKIQAAHQAKKKAQDGNKARFISLVGQMDALLQQFKPGSEILIVRLSKELTALRWKVKPDQAFYNKDAEFLRLLAKAKSMGIKT